MKTSSGGTHEAHGEARQREPNMDDQSRRQLLHDIRGRMNGLQLCVAALESSPDRDERIEFLDDIEKLCDKMDRLMHKWETYLETAPSEVSQD